MTPTKPLYIHLDEALYKQIAHLAIERGVSKAVLVRQWIAQGLAKEQPSALFGALNGQ